MTVAGPERRKPGASRVPFEALVEIAAPEGASFEAESVDLSAAGMHLRTAYLPKVGTPLRFRFEPGDGEGPVVVDGEVVWAQDGGGGCEFGVRFSEIGGRDAEAIEKIVRGKPASEQGMGAKPGAPVRIHIEGMAAPMRATLRDDASKGAVVGSELKMLKLGAVVELEDKERGTRRPARVDSVDCEIDPGTRIPQLVVKLRYAVDGASDDVALAPTAKAPTPAEVETAARAIRTTRTSEPPASDPTPSSPVSEPVAARASEQQRVALPVGDGKPEEEVTQAVEPESDRPAGESRLDDAKNGMKIFSTKMREVLGGAAAHAQSSVKRLGARMSTTVALLAKKKNDEGSAEADTARRTTSSFVAGSVTGNGKPRTLRPQGGSREAGADTRLDEAAALQETDPQKLARRRQIGIAAGVMLAVILGFFAFRKPAPTQPIVQAPAPELAPAPAPIPSAEPVDPMAASADPAFAAVEPSPVPPLVGESTGLDAKGNPNPFGTPSVKKGTKMLLRLDGPVAEIKGMQMPNGFVVSVPNRKSLEAAGPLAAKDSRITSAKVVNQPGGAELTIAFKDGASPSYAVRAKGDALEIVLASEKHVAKKSKSAQPAKSSKKKKK